ncbi:MAG: hypothetical protein PHD88_01950 [Firmicutes bacterium]|nr:hypothetical protein [Bacillota bacterium]MDD4693154.1 hypothetical protein [Bacillota bacterium]
MKAKRIFCVILFLLSATLCKASSKNPPQESIVIENQVETLEHTQAKELDTGSKPHEAKDEELKIKSTEGISGDSERVFITGDVRIEGTDFLARGAEAEVDLVNKVVRFSGGVTVSQDQKQFVGEELLYNYKTKSGTIKAVSGNIQNNTLKDDMYIYGQEMSFEDKYLRIDGGKITSCSREDPHYHIAAKVIEIYEDDKLILRHLYYKEGNFPLLYFPYYQMSLKERENYLKFPQIGSSAKEGFYLKFTYVYTLNKANKGEIYLDYLQKLGIGQGIHHKYTKNKTNGDGRYYLIYSPYENKLKLVDLSGSFITDLGNFQLSANAAYKNDLTELSPKYLRKTSLNSVYRGENYNGNLRLNYVDEDSSVPVKEEFKLDTSHIIRLNKEWRLNLSGNITHSQKSNNPWVTVISYDGTLNYNAQRLIGTLRWQQEDRSLEQGSTYNKLLRQPELVLRSRSLKVFDWPVTLETTLGSYKEQPRNVSSNKLSLKGTLGRKTYKITDHVDFSILLEGQGTTYNIKTLDPYVLSWRGVLGLTYKPVQNLSLSTDYTKRNVYGNSPFSFDRISNIHSLDFRLYNTFGFLSNESRTGYDLIQSSFKNWDNTHRFTFRTFTASFEHSYKLQPFEPIKFAGNLNLKPNKNVSLQARINYSKENNEWKLKELNGKGQLDIGSFTLKGEATYNTSTNKYSTIRASIGKDLHCRRIDFTYDHVNKAVWFEFRIHAIGDKPMKLRVSESGIDFSSDMLTALSSGN